MSHFAGNWKCIATPCKIPHICFYREYFWAGAGDGRLEAARQLLSLKRSFESWKELSSSDIEAVESYLSKTGCTRLRRRLSGLNMSSHRFLGLTRKLTRKSCKNDWTLAKCLLLLSENTLDDGYYKVALFSRRKLLYVRRFLIIYSQWAFWTY